MEGGQGGDRQVPVAELHSALPHRFLGVKQRHPRLQKYGAPPEVPVDLVLVTEPEDGSMVCAELSPPQAEPCELSYRLQPGSYGSASYSSGVEKHIDAAAGTRVTLACADGFGELMSDDAGCPALDLEPWGSICVEHDPALQCLLHSGPAMGVVRIEGCNTRVPAGRYEVECRAGTADEDLVWEACEPIEVEAGETAEIRCW